MNDAQRAVAVAFLNNFLGSSNKDVINAIENFAKDNARGVMFENLSQDELSSAMAVEFAKMRQAHSNLKGKGKGKGEGVDR